MSDRRRQHPQRHPRSWAPEELEYLRTHVHVLSWDDIAKHLRRSKHAVKSQAERRGWARVSSRMEHEQRKLQKTHSEMRRVEEERARLQVGDTLIVERWEGGQCAARRAGRVIATYGAYALVDLGQYRECFLWQDIHGGRVRTIVGGKVA